MVGVAAKAPILLILFFDLLVYHSAGYLCKTGKDHLEVILYILSQQYQGWSINSIIARGSALLLKYECQGYQFYDLGVGATINSQNQW